MSSTRKTYGKVCTVIMLVLSFLLSFSLISFEAKAQEISTRITTKIRVAYPIQSDFSEYDKQTGKFGGFFYEYLMEISQYTGWEYEFDPFEVTNESLNERMEAVKAGNLDVMTGLFKIEDKPSEDGKPAVTGNVNDFAWPDYSSGIRYLCIYVDESNSAISDMDYGSLNNKRIAVRKSATNYNAELDNFLNKNKLNMELVECDTETDMLELMQSDGEDRVDAMLGLNISRPDNVRTVAQFFPTPYYFAINKDNVAAVQKFNMAMLKISESDPQFESRLFNKYFNKKSSQLHFTLEEQKYIEQTKTLKVIISKNKAPMQYIDRKGNPRGIAVDILDYVANKTGLKFSYIAADSANEIMLKMQAGEVDILAAMPYDYGMATDYNSVCSRPFIKSQLYEVMKRNATSENLSDKVLALPVGLEIVSSMSGAKRVDRYSTVEECIKAVESGDADITYGNSYVVDFYLSKLKAKSLRANAINGANQELSMALARPIDGNLLSIVNKTLLFLPNEQLQSIISKNTIMQDNSFFAFIERYPLQSISVLVAFFLLLIAATLVIVLIYIRSNRRMNLEHKRHMLLSTITNELYYEYDFKTDIMTFSKRAAFMLGINQKIVGWKAGNRFKMTDIMDEAGNQLTYQVSNMPNTYTANITIKNGVERRFKIVRAVLIENGVPRYLVGKMSDIQGEFEEKENLIRKSEIDGLTGLYDATATREKITTLLENKFHGVFIIVDIDYFKEINDKFGHFKGDRILAKFARILKKSTTSEDIVGRLGGDEFIVYFKNRVPREVIEEKYKYVSSSFKAKGAGILGDDIVVTLSAGVVIDEDNSSYDALYQKADLALYDSKKKGRNTISFYQDQTPKI